ncbi:disease resistance protein RPP5-like [Carya illinoinensis]|uniref:disease resistance protein RPP5-like n=1 Tax=Carya illinoinensis TaxID=32201 RepID=UPI001C7235BC|nr:disease resistance protein RPP5-like [Carya illinoinensis]
MTGLNKDDAFQLFCLHAFKREKPVDGYGEFVEQIVNYAGSIPLALTVLGSDLYGRSESEWVSAMDQYKQISHQDIQKILQTSYDRLSEDEKNAFLDIACFFNGQLRLDDVTVKILDSFGFCPNFSIPRLKEKCLISVFDGRLQMHDLLRDMGREVVRQESPKNPRARSRLFFHKDICEVLEYDINLMVMNIRGCEFLTKISDISKCPNLQQMDFKDCKNLVKVHKSVALLDKLGRLNLSGCTNLKSFPRGLLLRSLQFLDVHLDASVEDIGNLANPMGHGSQLSKRRRVDYDDDQDDHNIESNLLT